MDTTVLDEYSRDELMTKLKQRGLSSHFTSELISHSREGCVQCTKMIIEELNL